MKISQKTLCVCHTLSEYGQVWGVLEAEGELCPCHVSCQLLS